MATSTKFANANAVVTTGWTNPTNAYADEGTYATCAPGKNLTVNSDYGFPAFAVGDIPNSSTINSVTAEVQWKVSTTSSIDTLGVQLHNPAGTGQGSETTTTTATTADSVATQQVTSGITLAALRVANTVVARVRASRGNTNTAFTASLDYVKVAVDYTAPNNMTGSLTVSGGSSLAATVSDTNRSTAALAVSGGSALAGVLDVSDPPNNVTGALVVAGGSALSALLADTNRFTAALASSVSVLAAVLADRNRTTVVLVSAGASLVASVSSANRFSSALAVSGGSGLVAVLATGPGDPPAPDPEPATHASRIETAMLLLPFYVSATTQRTLTARIAWIGAAAWIVLDTPTAEFGRVLVRRCTQQSQNVTARIVDDDDGASPHVIVVLERDG